MTDDTFYLGKIFDSKSAKLTPNPLQYDPADLTTHAVVTGMTGSGKTGLCIGLLEEAALQGVPAIIIDPKGDLTNLLLHFPNLLPQDFQPWIDPEVARRAGKPIEDVAKEAASSWRAGLKEWGIGPDRIQDLQNIVKFAVYTPGSDAGIPVSVLSSLAAPDLDWESNREALRERISSTVTALLGLVGMNDLDPIRSREHILLSNIFEEHWSKGQNLDLTELILQTQTPPFDKLGAFPVDTFFPPKDRMELAMVLNNILAAPAFEAWREGDSLNVQALLFTPEGQPRHSIFYLAHLSDGERMFFTTLLLSAVETWMRTQSGTNSLRALLYMDEIYGYLPPTANPPSKQPLLRMLKQARAFGLGLLLATQNPVDMDYKALSNTGTWFIGKLQTERDKNRLLDGLESLAGGFSRAEMDKLISALGKRVFVMNNVHEKNPILFQTRWAMNFLAGPLTRSQIRPLNQLVGSGAREELSLGGEQLPAAEKPRISVESLQPVAIPSPQSSPINVQPETPPAQPAANRKSSVANRQLDGSLTKPTLPASIREYFLPQNFSLPEAFRAANRSMSPQAAVQGVMYRPTLLAAAQVRILDRKYGVDAEVAKSALIESPDRRGVVRWEDFPYAGPSLDKVETAPAAGARFSGMESPLNDSKMMTALQKDFVDWLFRNTEVIARANLALKIYAGPDVSQAEFMRTCADTARDARDTEIAKKAAALDKKIKTLEDKLVREERELREDETELQSRKMEEYGTHAENVISLFAGSRSTRKLSSSLSKRRMTENAKADVEESVQAIAQFKKEIASLQREREAIVSEINDHWGGIVNEITEVSVKPKKTDIFVNYFGVAWKPYYIVQAGDETIELPAFGAE